MADTDTARWLTVAEASQWLGITRRTFELWRSRGWVRQGRRWTRDELDEAARQAPQRRRRRRSSPAPDQDLRLPTDANALPEAAPEPPAPPPTQPASVDEAHDDDFFSGW